MRVITGKARGHKLLAPEGLDTRPTTDRIKESLFNIIAPNLQDSTFLDLFCGSGAIGIEALSRGAKKAVFVDNSDECQPYIKRNLEFTKLIENATIIKSDAINAINYFKEKNFEFDIIFMDPPYKSNIAAKVLLEISKAGILKKTGYVIIEAPKGRDFSNVDGFSVIREKAYGKTTTMVFLALEE
ncbi:MAG: 16S rRNA (guanine(966)-N(2))-methyltransferase RsmD [Lachnospiraceae bacterium]|nr:16S rRNA (guanine(966)-N(2))-methyltransferase RsmD [Lachnospiraceae bacterium]